MARRGRKKKVSVAEMTLTEIRKLYEQVALRERERLPELKARQAELSAELMTVNAEITAIEGVVPAAAAAPARRGRAKKAAAKRATAGRRRVAKAAVVPAAPKRRGRPPKSKAAKAVKAKAAKKTAGRPRKAKVAKAAPADASRPRRGRPRKEGGAMTLRQAITNVLSESSAPLAPSEIRDIILQKKMIPKITPSFHQQVTGTLSRNAEFKRVGKGKYSL